MRESKRVRIFQDQGELAIEIEPYADLQAQFRQLAATLIFTALTAESVRTLSPLIRSGHELIGSSYIAIFAVMATISARRLAWLLFGHEEIVLRGGLLSVSSRLGVLKTSRTYRLKEVKDLHVAFRFASAFSISRGRIGFYHEGKMRYMADRISTADAKTLVGIFRRWLPKELWTPVLGL